MLSPPASDISQITPNNPRQIAISTNSPAILYTVPAGRKFVGYIYAVSNGAPYNMTTANGSVSNQSGSALSVTSASTTPFQIVLVAGTSISGSGISVYVLGVESDL